MASANIAYERVDSELIEKAVMPAFLELGYELTNYHCVGDAKYPEQTLVSIRESSGRGRKRGLAETLKSLQNTAEGIAEKADGSRGRPVTLKQSCIWLGEPKIIGSYSDSKTAEDLFPQLALDYVICHAGRALREVKEKLSEFGEKLAGL